MIAILAILAGIVLVWHGVKGPGKIKPENQEVNNNA
jgi:hypothetical protein